MRPYIFSFRIGGVVVRAEPSWLFLALLVGWSLAVGFFPGFRGDFSLATYIVMAVTGVAGLTFSIVAHELSHTFVGRPSACPSTMSRSSSSAVPPSSRPSRRHRWWNWSWPLPVR